MAQNNYPGPTKIVSPEVARLHNIVLSVSKLLCIHARGSDCDHRAGRLSTNERPGSGGGDQSEGGRVSPVRVWVLAIIALSLTEIDTNADKKQSLHLRL